MALPPVLRVDVAGESLQRFATRVQPILMNACAFCHYACVEHVGRFLEREPGDAHFDGYDADRGMAELAVAQAREVLEQVQGATAGK